jgi:putative ATPase
MGAAKLQRNKPILEQPIAGFAPLAERLRPQKLDEVVGQQKLLGPGKPLRIMAAASCIR